MEIEHNEKERNNKNKIKNKKSKITLKLPFAFQMNQIILFFSLWASTFVFGKFIRIKFYISFWISELNNQFSILSSTMLWFDLIFIGPIFSIFALKVFRNCINTEPYKSKINERTSKILNYVLILGIAIWNTGNAVHIIANWLNSLAFKTIDYDNGLYHQIYFWDEFFGHTVMAIGFNIIFYVIIYILMQAEESKSITKKGILTLMITSTSIAIGTLFGYMEGQTGLLIMIFYISETIFATLLKLKNNIQTLRSPMFLFILLTTLVYIIGAIIYGVILGMKPYYPFFKQPGESLWS